MRLLAALPFAALLLIAAGDPATETEHVVAKGETLSRIAERAGVPLDAIAETNGIAAPYAVKVGRKLTIPRQRSHVVQKGESGFEIGFQYGTKFSDIAEANGLDPDAPLKPGRRLIIPAQVGQPAPAKSPARLPAKPSAKEPAFRAPSEGKMILGWHRRLDGTGHEGLDFELAMGDPVRAAAAGRVIFAGVAPERFGNLVVIDHGGGWASAYGHLDKVTVRKNEKVRAGERVGLGGQSGEATEPELHFEIRKDGQPVDPAPKLGLARP
ncbi:MAG: M23 family metallopeptidase [Candidatus Andeanibacterium colombiense]|uniref:M23 family metallopeptidase n=1 Tax=Candidatus Andeanibacterium colombiense TaxID=3121345 RepID=A0AAJ5X7N1_9SPHN|nr:MAG: M23 family metallopeptidase [Sphingomonadaceae bacterium]